ncbi:MAG: hypothetical protein ACRD9L_16370 [Bryobacteraceae bacterium]
MNREAGKFFAVAGTLLLSLPAAGPLRAQAAGAMVPDVLTTPSTTALPNAENVASSESGNAAALSLQRAVARAVMAAFPRLRITAAPEPADAEDQNQAKPPSSNPGAPSLQDLGFPPDQTQGNAEAQARLDRRSHMLKIHQRLGLITTIPLLVTLITSGGAGGKNSSASGRDLHGALGLATAGMYFTTASFAIRAPRVPGTTTRGPIRLHKALAWIHGPGMILTSILGVLAYDQLSHGERVHGIANAHSAVAWVTSVAYGAAILSVSIRF